MATIQLPDGDLCAFVGAGGCCGGFRPNGITSVYIQSRKVVEYCHGIAGCGLQADHQKSPIEHHLIASLTYKNWQPEESGISVDIYREKPLNCTIYYVYYYRKWNLDFWIPAQLLKIESLNFSTVNIFLYQKTRQRTLSIKPTFTAYIRSSPTTSIRYYTF